jgi:hypothetical protein
MFRIAENWSHARNDQIRFGIGSVMTESCRELLKNTYFSSIYLLAINMLRVLLIRRSLVRVQVGAWTTALIDPARLCLNSEAQKHKPLPASPCQGELEGVGFRLQILLGRINRSSFEVAFLHFYKREIR